MRVLENLKPEAVFGYFEEISAIPRGSGNMKQIADFCIEFAKERKLEYHRDDMHNVIIIKEATKGYENSPAVIMQGHLDIVCEKVPECDIDFEKDGIKICVEGDKVTADGTTLGADNGIAIAMILAVLDSKELEHPRVEAVFTVDEETGLYGAEAIDVSMLKAKKFINLDSEEEGIITVSCAGGITAECSLPIVRKSVEGSKIKVVIDGLAGGHSGTEIDKGRGNANIFMGRLLCAAAKKVKFNIADLQGGRADNVITKKSEVEIIVDEAQFADFEAIVKSVEADIKNEFKTADPDIKFLCEKTGNGKAEALDEESTARVISLIQQYPNGIQTMSMDIKGLVETSLNLGILEMKENSLFAVSGLRSSLESPKWALCDKIEDLMNVLGGTVEFVGNYPGWGYKKDSDLRETVIKVFKEQYGKEPVIEALHAGLECGMFSEKIEDLDCVSIGPDLRDVHTPDEWMSIPSVQRTWELVVGILKASK